MKAEPLMLKTVANLIFAVGLFLSMAPVPAQAQAPALTPQQQERAEALFGELRCVVCQNQSIADSDADVAKDLRQLVKEQIASGASNTQVKNFLVARYGEFVLLKPSFALHTLLLWISPILFLIFGIFWSLRGHRRTRDSKAEVTPLSDDEQGALEKLVREDKS